MKGLIDVRISESVDRRRWQAACRRLRSQQVTRLLGLASHAHHELERPRDDGGSLTVRVAPGERASQNGFVSRSCALFDARASWSNGRSGDCRRIRTISTRRGTRCPRGSASAALSTCGTPTRCPEAHRRRLSTCAARRSRALPEGLTVGGGLDLMARRSRALPEGLSVGGLDLSGTQITRARGLSVGGSLDLSGTHHGRRPRLSVGGFSTARHADGAARGAHRRRSLTRAVVIIR